MARVTEVTSEDFGNLIRAAHRTDPCHRESARRLARYLLKIDALEELVREFRRTLDDPKADPECLHCLGVAALMLGDNMLAESVLSRAVTDGHADSIGPWARSLNHCNRKSEAYSAALRRLEQCPHDDWASQVAFKILLADKRHAELWDLCWHLVAIGQWTPRIISAMTLAAQSPEDVEFVRTITDRQAWVSHKTVDLDPAWTRQLSLSLKETNSWSPLPRVKATVGSGRRIEEIHRVDGNPQLHRLFELIRSSIGSYIDERAGLFGPAVAHPMQAMRPDPMALTSWAIAVNGDGHEDWHIHPDGWLSGVFYLEVPDLSESEAPHAGQIEFGPYPLGATSDTTAWPGWTDQPRSGDLILFPSYFPHRTWPTYVGEDRVCISFDVLRRGIQGPPLTSTPERLALNLVPGNQFVRDRRTVSATNAQGSPLLMNMDSGQCLVMNDTAAILWDLLRKPLTTSEMTRKILLEYDGNEAEVQSDVADTLGCMVSWGFAIVA